MVSNNLLSVDEYSFVAKTSCTWCWRSDLCRLKYSLTFTGMYIVYNGNKDNKKPRRWSEAIKARVQRIQEPGTADESSC